MEDWGEKESLGGVNDRQEEGYGRGWSEKTATIPYTKRSLKLSFIGLTKNK